MVACVNRSPAGKDAVDLYSLILQGFKSGVLYTFLSDVLGQQREHLESNWHSVHLPLLHL